MSINIHIEGDRNAFLSKKGIDKFKDLIRKEFENQNIQNINSYSKFLKDNFEFYLIKIKDKDLKIGIRNTDLNKKKKYLELKLNELRQKRMSQQQINYIKEKTIKKNQDNEKIKNVLNEYENVKKLTKNPILNPLDVYKNKEQYKEIIKELVITFGENNPFGRYYKLLLESII